ncbi:MAG TPA: universal stress protein [Nocardioides sp.]|nr:universal stress protein [Nocardioides sp.]
MMGKVVLSVDGSEAGRAATEWCVENLAPGTTVIAVCGISDLAEVVLGLPGFDEPGEHGLEEALNTRWSEPLRRAGLYCIPRLVHHRPMAALLEVVAEELPDAVIVGKGPHRAWAEAFVADSPLPLVHRMPCPVVLVPARTATAPGSAAIVDTEDASL